MRNAATAPSPRFPLPPRPARDTTSAAPVPMGPAIHFERDGTRRPLYFGRDSSASTSRSAASTNLNPASTSPTASTDTPAASDSSTAPKSKKMRISRDEPDKAGDVNDSGELQELSFTTWDEIVQRIMSGMAVKDKGCMSNQEKKHFDEQDSIQPDLTSRFNPPFNRFSAPAARNASPRNDALISRKRARSI